MAKGDTNILTHWFSVSRLSILLVVITFIVYANTLQNGFVLDDGMVFSQNTYVAKGIKGIPDILTTPRSAGIGIITANEFYRPLSMVMFAVEVQLFGMDPRVPHLVNVLVFIGCVLLLFVFLNELFERKLMSVAFIAALLFAVHPIHTEVVANIKSRDELLCYFCGFGALNLFFLYFKQGRLWALVFGIVALFLAYLSKETVITFLIIVPLVFFFYTPKDTRKSVMIVGGTVLATVAFLIVRTLILNKYGVSESSTAINFVDNALVNAPDLNTKLGTEILVSGKYLLLLIVPYPLLCNYSFNSIPFVGFGDWRVLLSLMVYVFLAVSGLLLLVKKRKSAWGFAILFYLITLSLFSNILFLTGAEMAERFTFFASTGFCLFVALAIRSLFSKPYSTDVSVLTNIKNHAILMPLLLVFGGITIARNKDWRSNYTLYTTDLAKSQDDCRLNEWLGAEIAQQIYTQEADTVKQKQLDKESIVLLKKAITIYPEFVQALAELGWVYERAHNYDSALYYDKRALSADPENAVANHNLGSLLYSSGRYSDAVPLLKKAIASSSHLKTAYLTLSNCYLELNEYDNAIATCNELLAIDPANPDGQLVLANSYLKSSNYSMAERHLEAVLYQKPNYVYAINNLGLVYMYTKRFPLAIEQFRKALALDPYYIKAYSNLARVYYFTKQYKLAISAINNELRRAPKNMADIPIMALCYQKMGDMEQAVKYEKIAMQVYPSFKLD